MDVKKPNFFIIGAPKCGTTSLGAWLSEHPEIYMSPVKEPHFYNTDMKYVHVKSWKEYERLFNSVTDKHIAVGEASVWYLFSQVAVPRIERELSDVKYIVMIRNPVDMAYSLHEQLVVAGNEHIKDFMKAWHLSEERARGRFIGRWCRDPKILDYKSACLLGKQVGRLYENVPKERVLILLLDEIKTNPRKEYLKVLNFLSVPDDGRIEFPVFNAAKERKYLWLRYMVMAAGRASGAMKKFFGLSGRGTGLLISIDKRNIRYRPRPPMPVEIREELVEYFREDLRLLSTLIDKDLSKWLEMGK